MSAQAARFAADSMLGRLARWLRILGYDTFYLREGDDESLLRLAQAEGRWLLTRDAGLAARATVPRLIRVEATRLEAQLREVLTKAGLPLEGGERLTRCPVCNGSLAAVERSAVEGRVPPHVYATHRVFHVCTACGKLYWQGSHLRRIVARLDTIAGAAEERSGSSTGAATAPGGRAAP